MHISTQTHSIAAAAAAVEPAPGTPIARQDHEEVPRTRPQGHGERGHLRGRLAEIDRDVRQHLKSFAAEHDVNPARLRELHKNFHKALRGAFEVARTSDAGPMQMRVSVREAMQSLRSDVRALMAPTPAPVPAPVPESVVESAEREPLQAASLFASVRALDADSGSQIDVDA